MKNVYFVGRNSLMRMSNDETTQSAEKYFRINYFLYIIDQAISSIESRFFKNAAIGNL